VGYVPKGSDPEGLDKHIAKDQVRSRSTSTSAKVDLAESGFVESGISWIAEKRPASVPGVSLPIRPRSLERVCPERGRI